jgi:hypothetical protein
MEIPIFFNAEKFINILIQRKEEVGETQIPEIDAVPRWILQFHNLLND